jgi:hypothetical protein
MNDVSLFFASMYDFRSFLVQRKRPGQDLWAKKDLRPFQEKFTATVPQHGVVMLQVKRGT